MKIKTIAAFGVVLSIAAVGGITAASAQVGGQGVVAVGAKMERHPELRRALRTLTMTKNSLQNAARDFDGHRAKAAQLVQEAIEEVKLAIKSDRD